MYKLTKVLCAAAIVGALSMPFLSTATSQATTHGVTASCTWGPLHGLC